jgi:hypothetical protein
MLQVDLIIPYFDVFCKRYIVLSIDISNESQYDHKSKYYTKRRGFMDESVKKDVTEEVKKKPVKITIIASAISPSSINLARLCSESYKFNRDFQMLWVVCRLIEFLVESGNVWKSFSFQTFTSFLDDKKEFDTAYNYNYLVVESAFERLRDLSTRKTYMVEHSQGWYSPTKDFIKLCFY